MTPILLAAALASTIASAPERPTCALRVGIGIACFSEDAGPENAADAFQAYGLDARRIASDTARAYLARFVCSRVIDLGHGAPIKVWRGRYDIAEPDGTVTVRQIVTSKETGARVLWMADDYLKGPCAIEGVPDKTAVFE